MKSPTKRTYTRTAKNNVLNFVQSLSPTPSEATFIASIFEKSSFSNRDLQTLLQFVASRASETVLESRSVALLGLPSLPQRGSSAPERRAL